MNDRPPPFDNNAEEAVVAALMVDPEAPDRIADIVYAADFYRDTNRWAFEACQAVHRRGEAVNQVTVAHELAGMEKLDAVGGLGFVSRLIADLPTPVGVEHYAGIVHRDGTYRRLIQAGAQMVALAYTGAADLEGTLEACASLLQEVSMRGVPAGPRSVAQLLEAFWSTPGAEAAASFTRMVRTGYPDLDAILAGLRPGQLVVVAARTSIGKSAFVLNIARNAAVAQNFRTLFFTLEMGGGEEVVRLLANESGIDSLRLRLDTMSDVEQRMAMLATGELSALPITFDDQARSTIDRIRSVARRHRAQHGVDLVVVDYLQLVMGSRVRREQNRVQEVGEVSAGLKQLARELDVPVVAAAQLSREVEHRRGKDAEPRLADLRESGSIEQDADAVVFLHNTAQETRGGRIVKVIVAKNRAGPKGSAFLVHRQDLSRFEPVMDLDEDGNSGPEPQAAAPWAS